MEAKRVTLLDLPLEFMEQILRNLPVGCIKSLKLVNKHMSVAVLGPCLHSFLVCQSTNLTPSSVSSLELLLRNDVTLFGRHVRHVRVMAETFAIASAENMLATGLRHPTESTITNRHGDNFVAQLDKPMFEANKGSLRELAESLEWMKAHVKAHEMILTTEEGEEEVVAGVNLQMEDEFSAGYNRGGRTIRQRTGAVLKACGP